MKLMFMSDLHIDVNSHILKDDIFPYIIKHISTHNPDRLIISGDISNRYDLTIDFIDRIHNETGVNISFVPGNHDLWSLEKNGSFGSYYALKNHRFSLIDKPIYLNDEYVLIGDAGWYDYSFGESLEHFNAFKSKKNKFWDGRFMKLDLDDPEFYGIMHQKFEEQFNQFQDKKIIFINHFVPYEIFVTKKHDDYKWNFCNAYMGSDMLGKLIDRYENIEYIAFGHTHKRFGKVEFNNKQVICNPFGYVGEWKSENIESELEDATTIIKL